MQGELFVVYDSQNFITTKRDKGFVLLIYTFLLKIKQLIFKSFMHAFLMFQDNWLATQINTSQVTKKNF